MSLINHNKNEQLFSLNTINPQEIEDCANQLNNIFTKLTSAYGDIKSSLISYMAILNSIKDCDNTFVFHPSYRGDNALENAEYEAVIRNVSVKNDTISDCLSMLKSSSIDESINIISDESLSLNNMAESLLFYIGIIELQLTSGNLDNSLFNGDIINYFTTIKDNSDWLEMKEFHKKSTELKSIDELYQMFHSGKGEKYDYVDFALDHLGIGFLTNGYSSFAAAWSNTQYYLSNDKNGKDKHFPLLNQQSDTFLNDDWCAEFVTYIFFNTGQSIRLPGAYIEVNDAVALAQTEGISKGGQWHSGTEKNYLPVRGDIFYTTQHTGIVLGSDEKYIYTIEGNTCNDDGTYYVLPGQDNTMGGCVNVRIHLREKYTVVGYYTPNNQDGYFSVEKLERSKYPKLSAAYVENKEKTDHLFQLEIERHKKEVIE